MQLNSLLSHPTEGVKHPGILIPKGTDSSPGHPLCQLHALCSQHSPSGDDSKAQTPPSSPLPTANAERQRSRPAAGSAPPSPGPGQCLPSPSNKPPGCQPCCPPRLTSARPVPSHPSSSRPQQTAPKATAGPRLRYLRSPPGNGAAAPRRASASGVRGCGG